MIVSTVQNGLIQSIKLCFNKHSNEKFINECGDKNVHCKRSAAINIVLAAVINGACPFQNNQANKLIERVNQNERKLLQSL